MSRLIQLDREGWTLSPTVRYEGGPVVAYIETHPHRQTGEECRGALWLCGENEDHPCWTQESDDPITLAPSIACRTCGRHYFIRAGRVELAE